MSSLVTPVEAWGAIGRAAGALDRRMAGVLRAHGLTPAQYEVLALLEDMRCGCCGEGECRCDVSYLCQNDLGARVATTKGSVSGLVQRLVEEGLISREPNPRNRRENAVRITAKGRAALQAAQPDVESALDRLFAAVAPADRALLRTLLDRVVPGPIREPAAREDV